MISGLRRIRTPKAPGGEEDDREDEVGGDPGAEHQASLSSSSEGIALPRMTPPTAATSSTIDVTSKASRWSERKSSPICAGEPNEPVISAVLLRSSARLQRDHDDDLERDRGRSDDRSHVLEARPAGPGGVRAPAQIGEDEDEHDHDRPGVDDHLGTRDELTCQKQVEHRERGEVADQRQRAEERVGEEDDGDSGREQGERRDDPDDPDEDVRGGGGEHGVHQDSALQTGIGVS